MFITLPVESIALPAASFAMLYPAFPRLIVPAAIPPAVSITFPAASLAILPAVFITLPVESIALPAASFAMLYPAFPRLIVPVAIPPAVSITFPAASVIPKSSMPDFTFCPISTAPSFTLFPRSIAPWPTLLPMSIAPFPIFSAISLEPRPILLPKYFVSLVKLLNPFIRPFFNLLAISFVLSNPTFPKLIVPLAMFPAASFTVLYPVLTPSTALSFISTIFCPAELIPFATNSVAFPAKSTVARPAFLAASTVSFPNSTAP